VPRPACLVRGILAGHPLDTAKTRLQAMSHFDRGTTYQVLSHTARAPADDSSCCFWHLVEKN